ncbi:uncharacterized protein LOC123530214 isoform X2 [Mercenaria mercenaria]|uniref:uncharacterized protein LOC123530214 isoform X2 n=1 Tax=Mercenaria mercenaria TaxID=6596 RepID=UPI00234E9ED6|nr:uncharacterized protein LOC123530214 isoform X2 [Mercenaria mercenaria]
MEKFIEYSADIDDDLLLLLHCEKTSKGLFSKDFNLDTFGQDECSSLFRFANDDLHHLSSELHIPEKFVASNGTAVSGIEALCVMLKRLSYPNRLQELRDFYQRPVSEISYISNSLTDFLYDNYGHLLSELDRSWLSEDNLHEFANAIFNAGSPLTNCWGFIDGTVRPICRPFVNQREVFNGHKRVHSLKFQSIVTPNGLIANMFGPVEGRRHDAGMLRETGLLDTLRQKMTMADGTIYSLYGDPAYPIHPHLIGPFRGHRLSNEEQVFNTKMSSVRVSVELLFNKIVRNFAFVDFCKNQKLCLQPVGKYYVVAAMLSNCHTCLYGNQVAEMFELQPPNLREYLHG